jgi:hypothetical protein
VRWVTRKLGELARRLTAKIANPIRRGAHDIALDPGAVLLPQLQGFRIISKGNPHILHDPVDLRFEAHDLFFFEYLEKRQASADMARKTGATATL